MEGANRYPIFWHLDAKEIHGDICMITGGQNGIKYILLSGCAGGTSL
jgi:hypothetical protein